MKQASVRTLKDLVKDMGDLKEQNKILFNDLQEEDERNGIEQNLFEAEKFINETTDYMNAERVAL